RRGHHLPARRALVLAGAVRQTLGRPSRQDDGRHDGDGREPGDVFRGVRMRSAHGLGACGDHRPLWRGDGRRRRDDRRALLDWPRRRDELRVGAVLVQAESAVGDRFGIQPGRVRGGGSDPGGVAVDLRDVGMLRHADRTLERADTGSAMRFFSFKRWRARELLLSWAAYWTALIVVGLGPAAIAAWRASRVPASETG